MNAYFVLILVFVEAEKYTEIRTGRIEREYHPEIPETESEIESASFIGDDEAVSG